MTIIQAAKYLEQIALSSPYIRTTKEGSVYDIMNTNGKIKYGVFVLSQTQHRQDDLFDYIGFNAFVIDRLDDDLESNRLQIQSTAKEVLANIVLTFKNRFYGATFEQLVFHPFTEKFVDLCAGQYCQLNIRVPRTLICEDSYGELTHNYELVPLVVTITENGVKEYKPETFDAEGFENVTIRVNVDNSGSYSSGYTSGYTDGYISGTTDGYSSGKTDGIEEQKAKLISTAITENGVFERVDGFNYVEVNVDTGITINNQTKSITATTNGSSAVTFDAGYTGLDRVNVNVNVPVQDYWNSGYTSGYTDGYNSGYTNGYQSGHTDGYNSGYTVGYASGYTDGYESGKTYSNGILNIVFDSNNLEGLVNKAAVVVTYSGISTTYIYTGETISISVLAGVDYTVLFLGVNNYHKPSTQSFTSMYKGTKTITGYYKWRDPSTDYGREYLFFDIYSDGILYWKSSSNAITKTIQYSKDGGTTWSSVTSSSAGSGTVITEVQVGDTVMFKGNNSYYSENDMGNRFVTDVHYAIKGNIMSMIYGDNFIGQTTFPEIQETQRVGLGLWGVYDTSINPNLEDAYDLVLPATALTKSCYMDMFMNCVNLVYAPELNANTLVEKCYNSMFWGCSKINYVKCLATDISADWCTENWLYRASNTGTFVKKYGVTWPTGDDGIPSGWTIEEE